MEGAGLEGLLPRPLGQFGQFALGRGLLILFVSLFFPDQLVLDQILELHLVDIATLHSAPLAPLALLLFFGQVELLAAVAVQLDPGVVFALSGGLSGQGSRVLSLTTQRPALPTLRKDLLQHFGRLASRYLCLLGLRALELVNLLLEGEEADPLLGIQL